MEEGGPFFQAFVYLVAAVVAVPIANFCTAFWLPYDVLSPAWPSVLPGHDANLPR